MDETAPGPGEDLGELLLRTARMLRRANAHALAPLGTNPHQARALRVTPAVTGEFGIVEAEVVRVQRIQTADEVPIAIMKNYLKASLVPGIESHTSKFTRLYDFLQDYYGVAIDAAQDRITAKNASFEEAQMLDVPVGTALVYLSRICFQNGVPVDVDHVSMVGGRYEFEVFMNGRYQKPPK